MQKKIANLIDLVSIRTVQRLQDKFAEVLNISLVTYDTKGKRMTKTSNLNRFWKSFIEDNPMIYPEDQRNITGAVSKAIETKETQIFNCYCNATAFAVPININDKTLAVFVGGRIRRGNPELKICHQESEKHGFDFDEFLEAYLELPMFNEKDIEGITKLLKTIANTISLLSLSDTQSKEKLEEVSYLNKLLEEEIEIRNMALEQSEKKYKSMVENAIDIICTIDGNGVMTSINETGTKFIRLPKDKIIGTHFSRYIHSNDVQSISKVFEEMREGKRETMVDIKYTGAISGNRFSINGKAVRDQQGKLTEVECVIRQITKEEALKEELNTAQAQYKSLIDSIPDAVYSCDMEGKWTAINKAGCELLGYKEDELIGKHIKDVYVNPEKRQEFLEEILEKGYCHGFVAHLRHKSGHDFYIETHSNLVKDKNGNPVAINGVSRDITPRVKLLKKIREYEKRFRDVYTNGPGAIILADKNGEILEYNRQARMIIGENIANIEQIFGKETNTILENVKRRGHLSLPVLPIEVNKKNTYISAKISKIDLENKYLFQIIFHEIKEDLHTKDKNTKLSSVEMAKSL